MVVLLAMTGVYFGYNMLRISNEYRQRITSLENRVDELEKSEWGDSCCGDSTKPSVCVGDLFVVRVALYRDSSPLYVFVDSSAVGGTYVVQSLLTSIFTVKLATG